MHMTLFFQNLVMKPSRNLKEELNQYAQCKTCSMRRHYYQQNLKQWVPSQAAESFLISKHNIGIQIIFFKSTANMFSRNTMTLLKKKVEDSQFLRLQKMFICATYFSNLKLVLPFLCPNYPKNYESASSHLAVKYRKNKLEKPIFYRLLYLLCHPFSVIANIPFCSRKKSQSFSHTFMGAQHWNNESHFRKKM